MAAFVIGKSLKDRRQTKAIEELFDKADKNGNGKISVEEYVQIFQEHGIELSPDEVGKVHYTLCYIDSRCFLVKKFPKNIYIQLCSKLYIQLLHKPYVNRVILTRQNLSLK